MSLTVAQALPFQRLGVFALPVMSIHRFCAKRSATAGVAACTRTLPLLPARVAAASAACCAAVTLWLVAARLLLRPVIADPWLVSPCSVCVARASRDCVADARAPVWRKLSPRLKVDGAVFVPIMGSNMMRSR
ncbi:hypothetical protein D3C77_304000 [compost metagenome]